MPHVGFRQYFRHAHILLSANKFQAVCVGVNGLCGNKCVNGNNQQEISLCSFKINIKNYYYSMFNLFILSLTTTYQNIVFQVFATWNARYKFQIHHFLYYFVHYS